MVFTGVRGQEGEPIDAVAPRFHFGGGLDRHDFLAFVFQGINFLRGSIAAEGFRGEIDAGKVVVIIAA